MANMKQEFPSQTKNRIQWILDTVREHQNLTADVLYAVHTKQYPLAKAALNGLQKSDRDALLQPNGLFTAEQIKQLCD